MKINEELKYPWDIRWTKRAKEIASFIPSFASVIDIGGGLGELYNEIVLPVRYTSLDIEEWNDQTIIVDLNGENWPELKESQFVVCAGILEYIEIPKTFLLKLREYSDRLILTYRLNSNGGIERRNELDFDTVKRLLKESGWDIVVEKKLSRIESIYFCKKIKV
jgi:hypothetical protein